MSILLTGFEAFGTVADNPSQRIVEHFAAQGDEKLICEVLPVVYSTATMRIEALLADHQPDAVLMLGVAQNRTSITPERFALNWNDSVLPDNDGNLLQGRMIIPDAPLAYMSTLPVDDFVTALQSADIPVSVSNHAGAFLCNHVFYVAQHLLAESGRAIPCGFIHVPNLRTDEQQQGLVLDEMIRGITRCLHVLRTHISAIHQVL